jgi:glutathione synthase/RimK-type ligase-like ATP-grasp enzyme
MSSALLIGAVDDPHIRAVAEAVHRSGHRFEILDLYRTEHRLQLSLGSRNEALVSVVGASGRTAPLEVFDSVWWRLKSRLPLEDSNATHVANNEFCWGEWRSALRSLPAIPQRAKWVNNIDAQTFISDKPTQLLLASKVGLDIPDTEITNDPAMVLSLFERTGRVIYKTLHWFVFPGQNVVYTNEISKSDVLSGALEILRAPGIFQEFVEKDYELRVTVVGESVFAVRICTPAHGDASVDWRHAQFDDIFESINLDADTATKILRFHKSAGLTLAVYDLIVTPKGKSIFLECNPGGQWLWLEDRLNIPITASLAAYLTASEF